MMSRTVDCLNDEQVEDEKAVEIGIVIEFQGK